MELEKIKEIIQKYLIRGAAGSEDLLTDELNRAMTHKGISEFLAKRWESLSKKHLEKKKELDRILKEVSIISLKDGSTYQYNSRGILIYKIRPNVIIRSCSGIVAVKSDIKLVALCDNIKLEDCDVEKIEVSTRIETEGSKINFCDMSEVWIREESKATCIERSEVYIDDRSSVLKIKRSDISINNSELEGIMEEREIKDGKIQKPGGSD